MNEVDSSPEFALTRDEHGQVLQLQFTHRCTKLPVGRSVELLPLTGEDHTWTLVREDPLTIQPSIQCWCGLHGFITAGEWQPVR